MTLIEHDPTCTIFRDNGGTACNCRVGDSPTVSEPRTATGRKIVRVLDFHPAYCSAHGPDGCDCPLTPAILAIEAEAAQPIDVERLAQALETCGLGLYHATEPRMLLEQSLPALVEEYNARLRASDTDQ